MLNTVELDKKKCIENSIEIFLKTSGLYQEGKKFERMRASAFEIRKAAESMAEMKAVYEFFEDIRLDGKNLHVGGKVFSCHAFERISPDMVKGAYLYAITAGSFELEDTAIHQVYADIWGNAFTDSARFMLKERLETEHPLSDSFGPGFYGMDILQINDIAELIDISGIGMEIRDRRIILPLKSCMGIYLAVDGSYEPLDAQCLDCKGNTSSCKYCMFGRE